MNKVILIGNLTKDPELRYTPNGVAVCTFTIAVNKRVNGENQADFIGIVAWQKTADLCATYLHKGRQAAIEGRIQTRSYDNKEGKKVYVTEVVAEKVEFIGGRTGDEGAASKNADSFGDPFANPGTPINISDDMLPF
ncbi:single-stranded DNA-binding protein [Brevibacillus borstelensis]|uniref:single-stranded DNA-binding protein n=1 Tax=Brevibacillus borstelensis TaxID=45462 RepID=UPI0030BF7027